MDRITIIGMRPTGVSIGLALKKANLPSTKIVGTDSIPKLLQQASDLDAVDETTNNIPNALKETSFVVIDMPLSQTKQLLKTIGSNLEHGCVVTDTMIGKTQMGIWAHEFLPDTVTFIGGRPLPRKPLINPEDASADAFLDAAYCVVPDKSEKTAVKRVVSFIETLGAVPYFIDPVEHDSYVAAVSVLPTILSSAIINIITTSAAWKEMSRFSGFELAAVSALASFDPTEASAAAEAHDTPLVHWIDQIVKELTKLRRNISSQDADVNSSYIRAWEERSRWLIEDSSDDRRVEIPSSTHSLASALFSHRLVERYNQITNSRKRPPWEYPISESD